VRRAGGVGLSAGAGQRLIRVAHRALGALAALFGESECPGRAGDAPACVRFGRAGGLAGVRSIALRALGFRALTSDTFRGMGAGRVTREAFAEPSVEICAARRGS
jgi:hypothetical protein